ncbi:hypothetical protein MPER_05446 [Moniliophthora perniciosa FA553]|nr:hypothetical protein MPER_05446 [Moniliophthora perniciosa FA553]
MIRRFSDYRRGFTVKVSQPGIPSGTASGILDVAAQALGYNLIYSLGSNKALLQLRELGSIPRIRDLFKYHLQMISTGSSCQCTRASSRLSLPCSESASGDVYHIQLWAILTAPALGALSDPDNWCTDSQEHLAYYGTRTLCRLLDTCGSAPELLDLVPNIFPLLESSRDKERLVKWLRSFPPEYADRILPVIEQVQTIKCRYR